MKGKDLTTQTDFEDTCDVFINAGGYLNNWRWPQAPGLESFKGTILHSAHWDKSVPLEGKKVGLIGNGYVDDQVRTENVTSTENC